MQKWEGGGARHRGGAGRKVGEGGEAGGSKVSMSALTVGFRYSLTVIHHPDLSSDYTSPQTNGNTGAINPKVMDEMSGETRPLTSRSRSIHSEFEIRAFIEGVAFLKLPASQE